MANFIDKKFHTQNLTQKYFDSLGKNKKYDLFYFSLKRSFSILEKINLKERVRLIDEIESNEEIKETATEQLEMKLKNENFKGFVEEFRYYTKRGITFDEDTINTFLGLSYNKYFGIIEMLQEYIFENNLKFDSIGYCYVILSTLKDKGFIRAFSVFTESSIFGVQQNLTVIVALISEIEKCNLGEIEKNKNLNYIFNHLHKYYSDEVIE